MSRSRISRWSARASFAACVLVLGARAAHANSAAPYRRDPHAAGGAFLAGQTSLVVDHETLTIECESQGSTRDCTFEAVYDVSNPTDAAEEVLGVFFGAAHDKIAITIDGVDVRRSVTPEQIAEAARSIPKGEGENERRPRDDSVTAGFVVRVEGGSKKSVKFSGRLEATYTYQEREGYALPAIYARHPLIGSSPRREERLEFTYLIAPIRTWGGHPSIDITIRSPSSWGFTSVVPGWSTTRDDAGRDVSKLVTTAEQTPRLTYRFVIPAALFVNGGPFGAVGPELQEAGPRFRVGYEVGVKDWMIGSLAFESFVDRNRSNYTFVPAFEAATPNFVIIIPSLSAGLGVPIQLHSSGPVSVGARAFLHMSFPLSSFIFPIDVYFDDPSHPRAALMWQLSF